MLSFFHSPSFTSANHSAATLPQGAKPGGQGTNDADINRCGRHLLLFWLQLASTIARTGREEIGDGLGRRPRTRGHPLYLSPF